MSNSAALTIETALAELAYTFGEYADVAQIAYFEGGSLYDEGRRVAYSCAAAFARNLRAKAQAPQEDSVSLLLEDFSKNMQQELSEAKEASAAAESASSAKYHEGCSIAYEQVVVDIGLAAAKQA